MGTVRLHKLSGNLGECSPKRRASETGKNLPNRFRLHDPMVGVYG